MASSSGPGGEHGGEKKVRPKLGTVAGVYIPVCLSIMSILMFLRFGLILGRIGLVGIVGLLLVAYCIDFLTLFSLSAVASNGEVKGGGIMLYLASVLSSAMNVVGLIDCIKLNIEPDFPEGYWVKYGLQTGIHFTGLSLDTLADNFLPPVDRTAFNGVETFRELFGILFPATAGILAGASLSADLHDPNKSIPKGTLWATLTTLIVYCIVALSMASSVTHESLLANSNILSLINLAPWVIFAGECATTAFSALIGLKTSAGLLRALARDQLLPGMAFLDRGSRRRDDPIAALALTYAIAQLALLADLNQIATFISMGFQMTFFVMNLACFFLKIATAPNFRPSFKFFSWQTAFLGSIMSAFAMFFVDETYAALAICLLVALFLLIHYLCPPKRWGDVSQNLIYHQVRKYLLRLRPEHIKHWRPHIILLVNNPRKQTRLIKFCNSLKKGSLYILGHVIVTDDFSKGVDEARLQQQAWTNYISESSRIKAFVQLTMSPSFNWGVRNLILSSGLGGMRPNVAIIGFYNMQDLRRSGHHTYVPDIPTFVASQMKQTSKSGTRRPTRRRGDTSSRILSGTLPTDVIRNEDMLSPNQYMTMLEDLALRYRLNVAVGFGFDTLEAPGTGESHSKKYVDLWPIQMSAEVTSDGQNILTTNFDTFPEETARVKQLLEKLRIEAKVMVFWLASGELNTYELIINGVSQDIDWDILVNDALKDAEWWDDLQNFRGRFDRMSDSWGQTHIAQIKESTSARPGVYNPHDDLDPMGRHLTSGDTGPMYGTMSTSQTLHEMDEEPASAATTPRVVAFAASPSNERDQAIKAVRSMLPLPRQDEDEDESRGLLRSKSMSPVRSSEDSKTAMPPRPAISRQSSGVRFSSRPVPETTMTTDGDAVRLSFADSGSSAPRTERPSASRQSSYGGSKLRKQQVPENKLAGESQKTIAFADPIESTPFVSRSAANSPVQSRGGSLAQSRRNSETGDLNLNVSDILQSYRSETGEQEGGSRYSTANLSLSFNDLPSRAQHLILNELMRRHSAETALLMSTLPIPADGTALDEKSTISYLSDVELLCNELPPTLMVLSNNMTVTVSL
ncbi:Vacuolar cation-chloride cotransporter 1 [Emericellopsis cladophorae]|uniref:Vacuolar cation-chloride cotransporter 1 n=1 Tax=Emericellopsis cladophorae TaxID=2686198 RepID=A0A9Q0BGI7_9HYPO|nr:Vacuolar cation-chloride cotransporter 1 [Emericellopsis cladophorae]KAI6785072.1 Vacuolar cation-chloride cotransporter 1 [Emericellopsis cladophorae]